MERRQKPRLLFAHAPGQVEGQLDPVCFRWFDVVPASSYSAAQEAVRGGPFSLILVDEGLLHGKALLLCQQLKRSQGAPILMQVADADPHFLEDALHAGAQDFIMGPARPSELKARARLARSARTVSDRVMGLVSKLTDLSRRDSLTKLFNRSVLEEWMLDALQSGREFHLLMLDLDRFKMINDRLGHAAGDAVLVQVAQILQKQLRHSDLVIRYGGEEFVVLLDGGSARAAYNVAQKIRRAVQAAAIPTAKGETGLTISIGLASVAPSRSDLGHPKQWMSQTLAKADEALYAAKAQGRNRVVRANGVTSNKQASRKSR